MKKGFTIAMATSRSASGAEASSRHGKKVESVEAWEDDIGAGAKYEVNIDDGWINAVQEDSYGQDVLAAITPGDARRLAAALERAAEKAESHPRWKEDNHESS